MQVTLNRGMLHSVQIQGDFSGPYIDLKISPQEAYALLLALEAQRRELAELAENYYDCAECGYTHSKAVSVCPDLEGEAQS